MEYLYLKWIDYETNIKYILGALCRDKANKMYYFKFNEDYIKKAEKVGFLRSNLPFLHTDKIYKSKILFPFFLTRVPRIEKLTQKELAYILESLKMEEWDEFEYLKKTNGKLLTDNYILEESKK